MVFIRKQRYETTAKIKSFIIVIFKIVNNNTINNLRPFNTKILILLINYDKEGKVTFSKGFKFIMSPNHAL